MNEYTALNSLIIEGIASNYVDGVFTFSYQKEWNVFTIPAIIFPDDLKKCLSAEFKQRSEIKLRIVGGLMYRADGIKIAVDHIALLNCEQTVA